MGEKGRVRLRQGNAVVRDGIPYANAESTLSLLPGAAVGEFLADHVEHLRGRLLDAGAGNQPYREWLEKHAREYVSVDAAPLEGLHALALADHLPFRDEAFDTVLATEVLEHVDDAERAADEILRVLKPGGHVLATVPYLYPTHEPPYDFRRFTHFGLQALFRRHGFDEIEVFAKGGPGTLVAHYAVLAATGLARAAGRRGAARTGRAAAEPPLLRRVIAVPQELVLRRRRVARPVAGGATRISLGYMVIARRPPQA